MLLLTSFTPLLLARTPLLFSHIVLTSVGFAKERDFEKSESLLPCKEIGREGIWTDRGWIRPQCGLRAGRTDERRVRRTKSLLLRHSKYQLLIQRLVLFFYPTAAQKLLWKRVFQVFSWKGIPRQSSFRSCKQARKAESLSAPVFFYPI